MRKLYMTKIYLEIKQLMAQLLSFTEKLMFSPTSMQSVVHKL